MSAYTITRLPTSISVLKDGNPVPLRRVLQFAAPPFAFGDNSDGARNLAYTILADHAGKDEARLSFQDFMFDFVRPQRKSPWSITTGQIDQFVKTLANAQYQIQEAMKKLKKLQQMPTTACSRIAHPRERGFANGETGVGAMTQRLGRRSQRKATMQHTTVSIILATASDGKLSWPVSIVLMIALMALVIWSSMGGPLFLIIVAFNWIKRLFVKPK